MCHIHNCKKKTPSEISFWLRYGKGYFLSEAGGRYEIAYKEDEFMHEEVIRNLKAERIYPEKL